MGIAIDVALAAAERVERAGGPRAGLFAWRKLAETSGLAELRARAGLAAFRCAVELRDVAAIHELARFWETVEDGPWAPETIALCIRMARAGLLVPATAVAYAEVVRKRGARSLYAYARCLDAAGDRRAEGAFAEAAAQADEEGDAAIARASRVRRAAWLAEQPERIAEAEGEAKAIDARAVSPRDRLTLARVLLRSPSRFTRATAIGLLDELVSKASPLQPPETRDLAKRALRLAARHADDLGETLTPMEVDRLRALFSREFVAKEAAPARAALGAIDRLARAKDDAAWEEALAEVGRAFPELGSQHRRARAALERKTEATGGASADALLVDAASALLHGSPALAAQTIRELATLEETATDPTARSALRVRLPAQAFAVLEVALGSDDAEVRAASGRLAAAMLRGVPRTPPRGWLAVALALAGAGMDDLATHARRFAALAKEPHAAEALASALTRGGWQLAREGHRSRAIAQLREAKAVAASLESPPSPASPPSPSASSPPPRATRSS